jgi:hypothetical protein
LIQRVRKTLASGHVVAVIGWRNNHHTPFTQGLSPKKVRFYLKDEPPKVLGDTIGLALTTPCLRHTDMQRIKGPIVYGIVLKYGTIIDILESCKDLLVVEPCACVSSVAPKAPEAPAQPAPATPGHSDDVLDTLTKPRKGDEMSKDTFSKFIAAVYDVIKRKGSIGKNELGTFRKKYEINETPAGLVAGGWIVGVVKKEQIGSYTAGAMMTAGPKGEGSAPTDPYEWAQWMVAQKEATLAKKAEIETKLAEIEIAEKALEQKRVLDEQLSTLRAKA